jgi:prevent-host-death family protein
MDKKDKNKEEAYINISNIPNISNISVAEAKSHFSEYISKVAYADEKVIITKRGKPIAALVSTEVIKKLKSSEESKGLCEIIGKWADFENIEDGIEKAYRERSKDKKRDVSF